MSQGNIGIYKRMSEILKKKIWWHMVYPVLHLTVFSDTVLGEYFVLLLSFSGLHSIHSMDV